MAVQSFREIVGAQPSTASPSNSTMVIIDAQNEYAEGKLKVSNAPSSRKAIAGLLNKYRDAGGKVVHVVHKTPNGAPVFTPDTKLAEEYEELAPKDGEKVIGKMHPSAFADTDLQQYLGGQAGSKLVLTGYMVSFLGICAECMPFKGLTELSRRMFVFPQLHVMLRDWDTTSLWWRTAWATATFPAFLATS